MGESHPTIERDPTLLASSTRSNAQVGSCALDDIAKSDVFVGDKSREAHMVRCAFAFGPLLVFAFLCHAVRLRSFPVDKTSKAAVASRSGGTTEARRGAPACVMANLICAALASRNSDHNSALVPVTNGTATLVPQSVSDCPCGLKLVMPSPGALKPRLPIEPPKFETFIGLP